MFEEIVDPDDIGAAWVGESQERPETAAGKLRKLSVPLNESYTLQSTTQRLIDDSLFDIAGWLTNKILGKFANLDGKAFISGDGVNQPRGLLTYPTDTAGDALRAFSPRELTSRALMSFKTHR